MDDLNGIDRQTGPATQKFRSLAATTIAERASLRSFSVWDRANSYCGQSHPVDLMAVGFLPAWWVVFAQLTITLQSFLKTKQNGQAGITKDINSIATSKTWSTSNNDSEKQCSTYRKARTWNHRERNRERERKAKAKARKESLEG